MTLPGLLVLLMVLAAIDRLGMWAGRRSGRPWFRDGHRPAPAPAFDEVQAIFASAARHGIEERQHVRMMRDEEDDGAPPAIEVDLEAGRAVIITRSADRR